MKKETEEKSERTEKRQKWFKRLFCLFLSMLFVFLIGYHVKEYFHRDQYAGDRFQELEEMEKERVKDPASASKKKETRNPDWIGWLKIKGTTISYPVMQRKGSSEYYLHRDFDGNYSFWGTPFLDIRCTPDSDNCFIYGHNINGGRMFGVLHKYASENYYSGHPKMQFRVGEEKRSYEIVSVIQTTTSSPVYSFTDTGNWEEYRDYVKMILNGSLYPTKAGEEVKREMEKDSLEEFFRKYQFLSLSTCRTWVGKNARMLVIGVRERK